jgi:hypothetical protein
LQHCASNFLKKKIKLKSTLEHAMKAQRRSRCICNPAISLVSSPDGARYTRPGYGCFNPRKRDPVPIIQEAKRAIESVRMEVENVKPTGVKFQNLPPRKKSLYRLH